MSESSPSLSIVIPVFNRFELLRACLASLERQTCADFEVLLVDDRSDAETKAFLRFYSAENPRIRFLENTGLKGGNPCRNLGLRASRGDYVMFLDSDDRLAPFCVEKRLADMRAAPDLDFIAYPCLLFENDPLDRLIIWNVANPRPLLDRFLEHDAPFQTSGPIWRKSSLLGRLEWDEALPGWQDWKFHIEALLLGLKGELRTRIDYYWNAPKPNSVTKSTHNTNGRIERMKAVARLAQAAPVHYRPGILSSITALGIRIAGRNRIKGALAVLRELSPHPCAVEAAVYILLYDFRLPPLLYLRGYCRKRVYRHYPLVPLILNCSNTYKLVAPDDQLTELRHLLNESRPLS